MTDISKCCGNHCKIKDSCYRYTCPASKFQSYFSPDPKTCVFFIDNKKKSNEPAERKSVTTDETKTIPESSISTDEVKNNI